MIAQTVSIENWPGTTITPANGKSTTVYSYLPVYYPAATNMTYRASAPKKMKFFVPPPLDIQGRAILKQKRRAVFQLVPKRRNRNLHIQ